MPTETKLTMGPWLEIDATHDRDTQETDIILIRTPGGWVDATEADKAAMRAAPDLLAALKEVVAISDRKHAAWGNAHAAIAKAESK